MLYEVITMKVYIIKQQFDVVLFFDVEKVNKSHGYILILFVAIITNWVEFKA